MPPGSARSDLEPAENQRRFLIAAGVACYRHLPESEQLSQVRSDIERMVGLFAERLGYERVLPEVGKDPTSAKFRERVSKWFHAQERTAEDRVVLYFSGHGFTAPTGAHYLCTADFVPENPAGTAVRTADILEWLAGSRVQRLLVMIDTCESGRGAGDLVALAAELTPHDGRRASGLYFIASARPRNPAYDGVFSKAIVEAIDVERWAGVSQQYLHPDALVDAINDRTAPRQIATNSSSGVTALPDFILNPRYDTRAGGGGDVRTLRRLRLDPGELAAHWSPRSRGVQFETQQGWYFTGRHAALRELVAWLAAREGDGKGRVVTGQPGSGKSAVLARLVLLSDPDTRRRTPLEGVPAETIPPKNGVDVAIHARGKSLQQVVEALADRAGIPMPKPSEGAKEATAQVVQALCARTERLSVVVDALDESSEPHDVAFHLLRPLMLAPNVRLIVGTRVTLLPALGPAVEILDLDQPPYVERGDLAAYVAARLLADTDPTMPTPYRNRPELARSVAAAVAERAFPNFLIGNLVSESLTARSEAVDVQAKDWRTRFPTSVRAAFDEYLRRFGVDEERVRHVLTPLAFAEGAGLPWDRLWAPLARALWGRHYDDGDVARALDLAGAFVVEQNDAGRSVYRLFHEALAECLREANGGRAVDVQRRFTETLIQQTPLDQRGERAWPQAHPYVRAHLAAHAAAAGEIDRLVSDPLFLLAAEPDGLLRALRTSGTGAGGPYLRAVHQLRERPLPEAASCLELAARQVGDNALADRIDARVPERPWAVPWVRWRPQAPHRVLDGHESEVYSVAVGEVDGRAVIVSGSHDATVRVWDLATGQPRGEPLLGHVGSVFSVAVGEVDGRAVIVSGSYDERVRVWDLATGQPRGEPLLGHEGSIFSVAVGEVDGRAVIVSGSADHTVRVWDLATGQARGEPLLGHVDSVNSVAVGEVDGRAVIVSGSADHTVRVWDLATGQARGEPLLGHVDSVNSVAVGEVDGRAVIVSGSDDGTVRVWRPEGSLVVEIGSSVSAAAIVLGRPEIVVAASQGILLLKPQPCGPREPEVGARLRAASE